MTDKKSFILYYDLCKIFSELTDEQAGQLIKEITNYAESKTQKNPKEPTGLSGLLNAISTPFKNHIDRDFELWLKRRGANIENGKKGGRRRKSKTQNNPNEGVTVTVTDTVTVNHSPNKPPEKLDYQYHLAGRSKGLSDSEIDKQFDIFKNNYLGRTNKDISDWFPIWKAWLARIPDKSSYKKPQSTRPKRENLVETLRGANNG
jgi:hypothetical protein